MKTNLPVILLKGIILLPNNDIRFEIDTRLSKQIIDLAEMFHDNKVLIVSQENPLEEKPEIGQLPRIGVISKIKNKIELPNGKTRILVSGISRAEVLEYINNSKEYEMIESFVKVEKSEQIAENEVHVLTRKLCKELENYIMTVPYMSNSVLGIIEKIDNLDKVTDIIVPQLPLSYERVFSYLNEKSSLKRTEMILEDIYKELEMFNMEKALDNRIRSDLEKNQKEIILKEKLKLIKEELGETSSKDLEISKMLNSVKNLNANIEIKERLYSEIEKFQIMSPTSPEINITKSYIDWLLYLPWDIETIDNNNLNEVKSKLNDSHYGLTDVKQRIIEFIAVKEMTNEINGPILCFIGPPGVGKTSLSKSIAKALNKNFVKFAVGGVQDETEIRGNRKTYLGACPGRIIQLIKKAKSKNPVFLIDEIDKMTKNQKGDPASALLEILDHEQNSNFSDNFIEEEFEIGRAHV